LLLIVTIINFFIVSIIMSFYSESDEETSHTKSHQSPRKPASDNGVNTSRNKAKSDTGYMYLTISFPLINY